MHRYTYTNEGHTLMSNIVLIVDIISMKHHLFSKSGCWSSTQSGSMHSPVSLDIRYVGLIKANV